jgi:hypothetical protein
MSYIHYCITHRNEFGEQETAFTGVRVNHCLLSSLKKCTKNQQIIFSSFMDDFLEKRELLEMRLWSNNSSSGAGKRETS